MPSFLQRKPKQPKNATDAYEMTMKNKDVSNARRKSIQADKDYENAIKKNKTPTEIADAEMKRKIANSEFLSIFSKEYNKTGFIDANITPETILNSGRTAGNVAKSGDPNDLRRAVENDPNMKAMDSAGRSFGESVNDQINGTIGGRGLAQRKVGKTKFEKTMQVAKVLAGVGVVGSLVGLFFVMVDKERKEGSGCFLKNTKTGENKKCNSNTQDDSCNGCDKSKNTCGTDLKCGEICSCSESGESCSCVELDYTAAMGNVLGDLYDVGKSLVSPVGDILGAITKYFPYVVITVGVIIALLIGVKLIGAFRGGQHSSGRQVIEIQTTAAPAPAPAPESAKLNFGSARSRRWKY